MKSILESHFLKPYIANAMFGRFKVLFSRFRLSRLELAILKRGQKMRNAMNVCSIIKAITLIYI